MECWRDIPEYEGFYQISNFGRVYSKNKHKILKQTNTTTGYKKVELYKNGKRKSLRVHRLVMYAFVGLRKDMVNHKDGNTSNNKLDNLEYCDQSYNMKHAYKIGLIKCNYKGLESEIVENYVRGIGLKKISKKFNIGVPTIRKILKDNKIKIRSISEAQNKYNVDLNVLKELVLKGYNNKQISEILKCPKSLVATRKYQIKKGEIIC